MDKSVFIINVPKLDDELVATIADFLHELAAAFESHYFHQLQRYHEQFRPIPDFDKPENDQNPF